MFLLLHPHFIPFLTTCRYGSSANLVLSTGKGVNGYTLDASLGEFILTHPNVGFFLLLTHSQSVGLISG